MATDRCLKTVYPPKKPDQQLQQNEAVIKAQPITILSRNTHSEYMSQQYYSTKTKMDSPSKTLYPQNS